MKITVVGAGKYGSTTVQRIAEKGIAAPPFYHGAQVLPADGGLGVEPMVQPNFRV